MNTNSNNFGIAKHGTPAEIFTLKNIKGAEVRITNYGATVMSLKMPDKNGKFDDIVLGFDSIEEYQSDDYLKLNPYFGAIIGRYANRIANAKFSIGKTEYNLVANNFGNTLHGGKQGFDKVFWRAKNLQSENGSAVEFSYLSKDGEQGFPGNLTVKVVYTLTNENELQVEYMATTDKETVVCLTHHSYFNLAGQSNGEISKHQLQINADRFMPVNENFLSTGEMTLLNETSFDFRNPREIGENVYDHNFVLSEEKDELRFAATVFEKTSGRKLDVFTTEPGIHFFNGSSLNGRLVGKNGKTYKSRAGFCLEPQHFPDSPNHPEFPTTILKPNEVYKSQTVYKFSTIN
jgi:aldose 1-epimerase